MDKFVSMTDSLGVEPDASGSLADFLGVEPDASRSAPAKHQLSISQAGDCLATAPAKHQLSISQAGDCLATVPAKHQLSISQAGSLANCLATAPAKHQLSSTPQERGAKGGQARAERLPSARRSEIARKAAQARWKKKASIGFCPDGMPD